MKSTLQLPGHYRPVMQLDLLQNKKQALLVNLLSLAIGLLVFWLGVLIVPLGMVFQTVRHLGSWLVFWLVLLGLSIVYMVLHELVHGIFMKFYAKAPVKFGLTSLYAYAGSNAYFPRGPYLVIAMAPVVIWGLVLLVLCWQLPVIWFWLVYPIQIFNLAGSAGDLYVTARFSRLPRDILVQDTGVRMQVYAPEV